MPRLFLSWLLAALSIATMLPAQTRMLRSPSVSAKHIAFAYAQNIWVVDRDGSRLVAVAWGRLSPAAERPLPVRLAEITAGLARLIAEHAPDRAAVECVSASPKTQSPVLGKAG